MASRLPQKIAWCLTGLAVVYACGDLTIFKGPLSRQFAQRIGQNPSTTVARVFSTSICRSQLERTTRERLWLAGQSLESLDAHQLKAAQSAALADLIEQALLLHAVETDSQKPPVREIEIQDRLRRFASRFESKTALESAMKSQGIPDEASLRQRLTVEIRQEKWLEVQIHSQVQVSADEALQWFTANRAALTLPERIQARHIFLPALDHPVAEAETTLTTALAELTSGTKNFVLLAQELSEDPATKDLGGELGWMSRERLPTDLANPFFSLELHHPSLVRSSLGWHLVEITARQPSQAASFKNTQPEILSALAAIKRRDAIADFRRNLRNNAVTNIEIFGDKLDRR